MVLSQKIKKIIQIDWPVIMLLCYSLGEICVRIISPHVIEEDHVMGCGTLWNFTKAKTAPGKRDGAVGSGLHSWS